MPVFPTGFYDLLFSWMVSVQEEQVVSITPHELLVKAHQFGVHPTTLKRQIDSFAKNKYFSLRKRGGGTLSPGLLTRLLSFRPLSTFFLETTLSQRFRSRAVFSDPNPTEERAGGTHT